MMHFAIRALEAISGRIIPDTTGDRQSELLALSELLRQPVHSPHEVAEHGAHVQTIPRWCEVGQFS